MLSALRTSEDQSIGFVTLYQVGAPKFVWRHSRLPFRSSPRARMLQIWVARQASSSRCSNFVRRSLLQLERYVCVLAVWKAISSNGRSQRVERFVVQSLRVHRSFGAIHLADPRIYYRLMSSGEKVSRIINLTTTPNRTFQYLAEYQKFSKSFLNWWGHHRSCKGVCSRESRHNPAS